MRAINLSAGAFAFLLFTAGMAHAGELLRIGGNIVKWRSAVSGKTIITFATLAAPFSMPGTRKTLSAENCGSMRAFSHIIDRSPAVSLEMLRSALRAAFASWESVANISFKEVADIAKANIIVGASVGDRGRAFANLSVTGQSNRKWPGHAVANNALGGSGENRSKRSALPNHDGKLVNIEQAYVCLSPSVRWKTGFDGNLKVYDLQYTFTHEIGHAIGLDHPGKTGAVMGYRYDERIQGFQQSDLAAVRFLYGPRRLADAPASSPGRPRK